MSTVPPNVDTGHKVLVGVLIMVVMLVIMTEVAGTSKQWATAALLLLAAPLMFEGFTHMGKLTTWAKQNPYNPTS